MIACPSPHETLALVCSQLQHQIAARRIREGIAILNANAALIEALDATAEDAAEVIWRVAQWVDAGWRDIRVLERLLGRMAKAVRSRLPLRGYAVVRMAEGMAALSEENPDDAIAHFDAVLVFEKDLDNAEVLAIAHYWKARCQRKKGEYDEALRHTVRARYLALGCGLARVAAVTQVLESWILFQQGKHKEALKTLTEAESALSATDDRVALGNIQSTYGRIYRHEGRYDRAVQHFTNAICQYRRLDHPHSHLARTLANMAYVKRLVALELRRQIDADAARRKQSGGRLEDEGQSAQAQDREQFLRVRDEAVADLDEAAAICVAHANHRSAGTVHLHRGLLQLDNGALDDAGGEGELALELGEAKQDLILMSRARILQCMVENAKLEEGVEGDPRRHAQAALEAMNAACPYLDRGVHDTAWEDFQALRARLVKAHTVDETLRAWSQGAVGEKTFKEISEQFAEIVIPKVWEHEGRKIARAATRLAISPKKVRRALSRAGLLRPPTAMPEHAEGSP